MYRTLITCVFVQVRCRVGSPSEVVLKIILYDPGSSAYTIPQPCRPLELHNAWTKTKDPCSEQGVDGGDLPFIWLGVRRTCCPATDIVSLQHAGRAGN